MQQYKDFIKRLFEGSKINVEKHHMSLFDEFINDNTNMESVKLIQNTQSKMIDSWKDKTQIEDIKSKQLVLTNGTVGKPYEFTFDFTELKLKEIGNYYIDIDENIGLKFEKETNKIFGVLKLAGEHIIILNFQLKSDSAEKPYNKKEIKLIVNPDPKSLWIAKDSDNSDKYWKADCSSVHAIVGTKQLVIASKRGRSHAQEGIFRDDDFGYSYFEETGWGIIAVADGAGSAKYSRKGSLIACNEVISYFENLDKERLQELELSIQNNIKDTTEENQKILSSYFIEHLGKAAFGAQVKIKDEALANNATIKDYSTTLIFTLIKKYDSKYVIASFWVGDGGIGIYNKVNNEIFVLGSPDSGEFAGQTRFLTMSDIFADGAYANRVKFKIVEDFTALILMTDGITDPKFQTDNNLNRIEKWNELWEDLEGLNPDGLKIDFSQPADVVEAELMNWLDFWSPGNHDDRTIAILY